MRVLLPRTGRICRRFHSRRRERTADRFLGPPSFPHQQALTLDALTKGTRALRRGSRQSSNAKSRKVCPRTSRTKTHSKPRASEICRYVAAPRLRAYALTGSPSVPRSAACPWQKSCRRIHGSILRNSPLHLHMRGNERQWWQEKGVNVPETPTSFGGVAEVEKWHSSSFRLTCSGVGGDGFCKEMPLNVASAFRLNTII